VKKSAALIATPMSAPHHSVSLTDLKASSASSLASAEATRLVHATLSQKNRYADESVSMIAGPSAASSLLELAPTTAVSMTLMTSAERSAERVGSVKRASSSSSGPSAGHGAPSSDSGTGPVPAERRQPRCRANGGGAAR